MLAHFSSFSLHPELGLIFAKKTCLLYMGDTKTSRLGERFYVTTRKEVQSDKRIIFVERITVASEVMSLTLMKDSVREEELYIKKASEGSGFGYLSYSCLSAYLAAFLKAYTKLKDCVFQAWLKSMEEHLTLAVDQIGNPWLAHLRLLGSLGEDNWSQLDPGGLP
ncbi:hypothetical protein llap_16243 [Limosa lapponica baueri]|uniref:Uncharacterized protein n=1 Tax=Limosa lapponica baueri TaxID=1758121 RepID=A0A2I0TI62_LIMLA|nr:hypothetical protein llap_16243 [Limosa lapponica baueri]